MEAKARKPSAVKHPFGVNKITDEPLAPVLMYTVVVLLLVFNHIMKRQQHLQRSILLFQPQQWMIWSGSKY